MNDIEYLVGSGTISVQPLEPYSEEVCAFAAALSDALLRDSEARRYPDVMTFAFWCRKGNIAAKKAKWEKKKEKRLGRGLAFQIAPSNVPVSFAFTYMFALLSGNATIVRAPSKEYPQIAIICGEVNKLLEHYPEIKKRTMFVKYPANNEITEKFSMNADVRVIWGGDDTVTNIRRCASRPKCFDLVFADRYSICILDGRAVEQADEDKLKKLAENFYNDTYLMDQNACSSPQLILWKNASEEVKIRFWKAVFDFAKPKYYLQAASCVDKYTKLCQDAVDMRGLKNVVRFENLVYVLTLDRLPQDITSLRGDCGYFYEYDLNGYEELINVITEKVQTITYFGIHPEKLRDFLLQSHVRGIERIVPVGKALDMDVIWDGYDIVEMMSRIIEVK